MLRSLLTAAIATTLAATLSAQGPCFDLAIGTDLNLFDDDTSPALPLGFSFTYNGVTYTDIEVCSNGHIWLGAAGQVGGDYTPDLTEFLTNAPRICAFWTDLNPGATGSGHVYYDNSTPGVARITWAGVYSFATTTPNSFQVTLDASNSVTIAYGPTLEIGAFSTDYLIGATPGFGAVANPVSLATRPVITPSNTFHDFVAATPGTPIPFGFKMLWTPTTPGYVISDLTCTPNSFPGPATADVVGTGCPGRNGPSLYEMFDSFSNPPDLSGLNLSFLPSGPSDYLVIPNVAPTWYAGFTNNLSMLDDQSVSITLPFLFPYNGGVESTIYVSSNGFLTLGATDPGSGCCYGDVFSMLSGPPRISGFWADIYPPGAGVGGGVFADFDVASGDYVITWNQVPEYFTGPPETFQIALNPSGMFTIRWQSVADVGHTWISGYSAGSNTADPGVVDLSAVNGAFVSSLVTVPLELLPTSLPQLGSTFTLDATNIQSLPNGVFCILLISTEIPGGIPLDGLGLTGCTAHVALPELLSYFNLTLGSPTTTFSIPIPNVAAFAGVSLMSQAISDDLTANSFGYRVSNGVRWNLGL
ncbi:MAG: hypothetical protein ABL997_09700 [Planctomycetota bacterium]